jgi:hypothetical protein
MRGRPRTRRRDNISRDVEEIGINPEEWIEAANNRRFWAQAVEQAYGL